MNNGQNNYPYDRSLDSRRGVGREGRDRKEGQSEPLRDPLMVKGKMITMSRMRKKVIA